MGIEVIYVQDGLYLAQRKYLLDFLYRFGMSSCKPLTHPIDSKKKLYAYTRQPYEDVTTYRSMIGSLNYATISRPNLAYAVGILSHVLNAPAIECINVARRVLR